MTDTTQADTALPYPLPDKWQLKAVKTPRWWLASFWMLVAGALGWWAVTALLRGDQGGGFAGTVLMACVLLVVGVTASRAGDERGAPHFVNAVALSEARVRPPDSWVHFFRETRPHPRLIVSFSVAGVFALVTLSWASVLAVGAGDGAAWALVLFVPLALGAVLVAFTGVVSGVIRWRHSSFGRRPMGLSVGRHGIARYFLDDVATWDWDSVLEVRATVSAVDKTNGDFMPGIVVVRPPDKNGITEDAYSLVDYEAHAWLIYTALRFWAEHPEHRDELSTTFAQQRILGWRAAMAAVAAR